MKTMKKFALIIVLIFLSPEVFSQNSVAYNISSNCNRISSKSWRCCGTVIVHWDGKISSNIQTSSNRWQGFTGAVRIQFKDKNQTVIYEIVTPSYGVNGESSRSDYWSNTVPEWVVSNSQYASSTGIHTSSNRTMKYIFKQGKKYLDSQTGFEF